MRRVLMCAVLAVAASCYGQQAEDKSKPDPPETKTQSVQAEAPQVERSFQLIFVVQEVNESGKIVNSRRYDTMATVGSPKGGGGSIRAGARVPIKTGGGATPMFTYVEMGANFDANNPHIIQDNHLALQVTAEISSFDTETPFEGEPRIRQNRWTGNVEVPIGGHKIIFSSDDLSSKKKMQIELTVTPVER